MDEEQVSAARVVDRPAQAVFAVLAEPARHADIDGTGWVVAAVDGERLTAAGQVFRVRMFHPNHPDGHYEMHNEVLAFDPPYAISWRPGYVGEGGDLEFGGWVWRYDLVPRGDDACEVTLTYDWSAVGPGPREHLSFPPFPDHHLADSLAHLAGLAGQGQ